MTIPVKLLILAACFFPQAVAAAEEIGRQAPDAVPSAANVQVELTLQLDEQPAAEGGRESEPYVLRPGEPIRVRCTIINVGKKPAIFVASDLRFTGQSFVMKNKAGNRMRGNIKGRPWQRGGRTKQLQPGRRIFVDVELLALFPPEASVGRAWPVLYAPDSYSVQFKRSYVKSSADLPENAWTGTLSSNKLEFRVRPFTDQEREELWNEYEKSKGNERLTLARILESSMGGTWDPGMEKLLADPSPAIRGIGCIGCARMGALAAPCVQTLETLAEKDADPLASARAAVALGSIGLRRSVPVLIQVVKVRKERCYRAAIRALGKLKDERAIEVLKDVAENDPEEWVRNAAKRSIGLIKGE